MDIEKVLSGLLETSTDKAVASESLNAIREEVARLTAENKDRAEELSKAQDLTKRLEQVNRELFLKIPVSASKEATETPQVEGISSLFK